MAWFLRLSHQLFIRWLALARPVTIGTRVMLVKDDKVLLVRHTYQDGWFMPGGGIKPRETPEQAARREAHEEVGAELGEMRLLGVFTNYAEGRGDHITLFYCDDFTFTGQHDGEIAELKLFPFDALPDDIQPGNRRRIEAYLQNGHSQPGFGLW